MKLRLPFALALAVASLTLAAVKLWPFTPPDRAARLAAADAGSAPEALRPYMEDALYEPLEKPQPGEWLAEQRESAQHVKDYRGSGSNLPDAKRKVLYLLPMGDFPKDGRTPDMEVLREYLGLFFCMEAKLAPAVADNAAGATRRINPGTGKPQLLTTDILNWLPGKLPGDAYCMLAVTMTDLYPQESWNFVFGQATLKERVGVFSLARNDPAFFGADDAGLEPEVIAALILRRACTTLSHETGHMFGWRHCRYYRCLMGGSNGQDESDRSPAALCPVCLHKLHIADTFDPAERQQGLAGFYRARGMAADLRHAERILAAGGK